MLCSNCGKNNANMHYTRIINGEKTEYDLCDECAKKLGVDDMDFNMPINFSNFLSDFFDDDMLLPSFSKLQALACPRCGLTYDDFAKEGKFGCGECYDTFSNKLDSILKNLHGSARHVGRKPKNFIDDVKSSQGISRNNGYDDEKGIQQSKFGDKFEGTSKLSKNNKINEANKFDESNNINGTGKSNEFDDDKLNSSNKAEKIEALNKQLKLAISEERYEDAAKIRDEIKALTNN